ncbi:MAG TPA: hypothetical protein VFW78_06035 [Bacteroidia bacterium]|nr:hypothetical protein [Bacteroidia bacterium]
MVLQASDFQRYLNLAVEKSRTGNDFSTIRSALLSAGADDSTADTIVGQLKSAHYLRRRKRGFVLTAVGSFMLLTGFLLTVFLFHHNSDFNTVMYGMTSVGVLLLLLGMVLVLGW